MLLSNRQIIGTRLISPFQSFHYQKEFTKPHRWRSRQQFFSVGVGEKSKKDSNIHNSTEKILCLPNIANENIRFQITKIHVKAGKAIKASQRLLEFRGVQGGVDFELRSDCSGIVSQIFSKVGAILPPNSPVLRIYQMPKEQAEELLHTKDRNHFFIIVIFSVVIVGTILSVYFDYNRAVELDEEMQMSLQNNSTLSKTNDPKLSRNEMLLKKYPEVDTVSVALVEDATGIIEDVDISSPAASGYWNPKLPVLAMLFLGSSVMVFSIVILLKSPGMISYSVGTQDNDKDHQKIEEDIQNKSHQ